MLNQRMTIANDVHTRLRAAERIADQSIVASAELIIALLEGGQAINAASVVGQEAFEQIQSAFAASSETRRRLVAAHEELVKVKAQIGLGAVALGGGASKKPAEFFTSGQLAVLEGGRAA